mgnify:CR=1 FL=1
MSEKMTLEDRLTWLLLIAENNGAEKFMVYADTLAKASGTARWLIEKGVTFTDGESSGEWKEANTLKKSSQFICTACGGTAYFPQPTRLKDWEKHCPYKYCPHCGAKMDLGE